MKKIKGIIFDLDGVLVFTDRYHYKAWGTVAKRLGIPFNEEINDRLRGVSRMESLDIILEQYHGETLDQDYKRKLAEEKNTIYQQLLEDMKPEDVQPEVWNTLKILKERGFLLAIGSSSKNAKYILEKTALKPLFDAISDGTNIVRSKPDPEVFLMAAMLLDLDPENCLVVEDAEAGIVAAKAAGMKAIDIGETKWSELLEQLS